jgi:alpha-L-fucosidase
MSHWFDAARLGLFVHWGHGSQRGLEISWPLVGGGPTLPHCQDLSVESYHASARTFCPERDSARRWLELARRAGARYAVLTAKHHDGFALWPTKLSDFSIAATPYRGDLVGEFVDAARENDLRVGLYYSLCDWHHPDYPAFTDADRPYVLGRHRRPSPEQWERFVAFQFGQLEELLTGYGSIDLVWFDGGWERSAQEWRSLELRERIRGWQPEALVNDRLPGSGDFDTPEQFIPPEPPPRRWETCLTMNESWAYVPGDTDYKSERDLVHALCEVAGRGGNLLLNASPTGTGALPPEQVMRLEALARWMGAHRDAIHSSEPALAPWQFYGPTTRRGDRVFLHLLWRPYDAVTVRGIPVRRLRAVRHLASGRELPFRTRTSIIDGLFNPDPKGEVRIQVAEDLVDPDATVIELELKA